MKLKVYLYLEGHGLYLQHPDGTVECTFDPYLENYILSAEYQTNRRLDRISKNFTYIGEI